MQRNANPEVLALVATADVKYARFDGIDSFKEELKKALEGEIVRALQQPLVKEAWRFLPEKPK